MASKIKQVIVVRRDLNMRAGKMAAQVAHASIKILLDHAIEVGNDGQLEIGPIEGWDWEGAVRPWLETSFTKIVLGCYSEAEMMNLYDLAKSKGLPVALIVDNGLTEFHNVYTKTCFAIGPCKAEDLDPISGHLRPI